MSKERDTVIPAAPGTEAIVWRSDPEGGWSERLDVIAWFIPEVDDDYRTDAVPILADEMTGGATVGIIQRSGRVVVPWDANFDSIEAFVREMCHREATARAAKDETTQPVEVAR